MSHTWRVLSLLTLEAVMVLNLCAQSISSQPDQDEIYLPGQGLTPAKLVRPVPAVVPEDPSLDGVKHVCAFYVVVGADGTPVTMELLNKVTSPFDDAAKTAVKQSQFEPGVFRHKPVPTRLMVFVPFLGKDRPPLPVAGTAKELKNFKNPAPTRTPEAEFSEAARAQHYEGSVLFRLLVTEDGLPSRVQVLAHALYGLDEKALEAVKKYRFKPATLEGIPVPTIISVEVNFRLGSF